MLHAPHIVFSSLLTFVSHSNFRSIPVQPQFRLLPIAFGFQKRLATKWEGKEEEQKGTEFGQRRKGGEDREGRKTKGKEGSEEKEKRGREEGGEDKKSKQTTHSTAFLVLTFTTERGATGSG
jgi:hypothetical protein